MIDISVVVPVRNAETMIEECLASIEAQQPREVILVDGNSVDRTLEIARRYRVSVLSDEGRGLPAARMLGVQAAKSRFVALVDSDVVLPPHTLERLHSELVTNGYDALQAGLKSVSGPGYWGQALVNHHRSGRSDRPGARNAPGLRLRRQLPIRGGHRVALASATQRRQGRCLRRDGRAAPLR